MRDDGWFAGFVAGEGCFYVQRYEDARRSRTLVRYRPTFQVKVRADDISVMKEVHESFGGRLALVAGHGRSNPLVGVIIQRKDHLAGLVAYFDRFPLRTKKQRDYALWRRAVEVYLQHGQASPELELLRDEIMGGRAYEDPAEVIDLRARRAAVA